MLALLVFVAPLATKLSAFELLKQVSSALAQGSTPSEPKPVVLTDEQQKYPLGLYMELLEDPSGNLTIDQVSSPALDSQFVPSQAHTPNKGFTESAYWVRVKLRNETRQTDDWLLEIDFPNMQYVDLYTPLPDGKGYQVKQSGSFRPISTRDILHHQIVFDVPIPTPGEKTAYLRFQSGTSMTLGLTLWSKNAFLADAQRQNMLEGLFFGVLLGLLVYNLFLLFSLRDLNHLYFVIELAATILFVASYDGYTELYLLPGRYQLSQYSVQLFFAVLLLSIVLFADSFLETKTQLPRLHMINLVIVGVWGVLMLLVPFSSYYFVVKLAVPWAIVSLIAVLIGGFTSLQRGFRPARLFLIAWSGLCVTLVVVMLARSGAISVTALTENLFRLGMLWLGVCWSLALADRINLLKAQAQEANTSLQKSERKLSQILEGLPLAVVLYGPDQKPSYMNRRTADILSNPTLGIKPEISQGRTPAQAIDYYSFKKASSDQKYPVKDFPPIRALHGIPASADDIEMDQGDKRVPLEIWASPITDDTGNVVSAVVAFQDISRRKEAESELVEYRRHLESLVAKRTMELDEANRELRVRLEWMSAIAMVTETMARSSDFTKVHQEIIEIIHRLFAGRFSFIGELDEGQIQLKILAHSGRSEDHPDLNGSFTTLPEDMLANPNQGPSKLIFLSKDQLGSITGPIGMQMQAAGIPGIVLVPLELREKVFGYLGLEMVEDGSSITDEESNLLGVFAVDIAQLIEDSRLFEQSKSFITMEERNRLARELHDSVTQTLFTASVLAEATPRMWEKDQGLARQNMEKLSVLIRGALAEMRSMLIELRSGELQNQSLEQLLVTLVEAARVRTHAVISFSHTETTEMPKEVTLGLYRIAREALNNAIIHADAAEIRVALLTEVGRLELHVQDDGCGFDPLTVPRGHLGVRIMMERAAEIGGEVQVRSEAGRGADVAIIWPAKGGGSAEHD
jgi:signal transduction histidine kinase